MFSAALTGFTTGLSLIVVIGAQNAFVLKQGLLRAHVLAVVLFCAASDAALIALGVAGAGAMAANPGVMEILRWGGVAFLGWYGLRAALAAWKGGERLQAAGAVPTRPGPTLLTLAGFTWLNPHVWLDTVVLVGALSAQFPAPWAFGGGAMLASFVFFFALGFGARILQPVFARPLAWRLLDALIAALMWAIAARLALGG
ncbi:LysE/ArgO family amino acid transporter [Pseudothioclava arenosa]|uniref:Amino acid transporter n=1 Tax=Pseudothioclava arenosa TaxID=1795308 RepID=A0A2A4CTS3_9RHOB|nr:LysE/ArgO family amino acid transporter [Pseudothioclava arenosa]PCD77484.1 amino acid transporter [Pseudothioclava arenosa]